MLFVSVDQYCLLLLINRTAAEEEAEAADLLEKSFQNLVFVLDFRNVLIIFIMIIFI